MEQTVKERLIQFIKYKGLNQRKPEIELGEDGKLYIKKDFTVIDKANERVLDFVKLL